MVVSPVARDAELPAPRLRDQRSLGHRQKHL